MMFLGLVAGGTFYADRPTPTRFGVVRPLCDVGSASAAFGPRYRVECMAAVEHRPPRYVVAYGDLVCGPTRAAYDSRCTQSFPQFRAWLLQHYQLDARHFRSLEVSQRDR